MRDLKEILCNVNITNSLYSLYHSEQKNQPVLLRADLDSVTFTLQFPRMPLKELKLCSFREKVFLHNGRD